MLKIDGIANFKISVIEINFSKKRQYEHSVINGSSLNINYNHGISDIIDLQESRAAARKPRDAASILFG